MKSRRLRNVISICVLVSVGLCICGVNSYAEINGNESAVISAVRGTYEYKGSYYKFKGTYVNQGINYLDSANVDLSADKASQAVASIPGYIPTAIANGYMVKVGEVATTTEDAADSKPNTPSKEEGDNTTVVDKTTNSSSTTNGVVDLANVTEVGEDELSKTKQELLQEATDLAKSMNLKVSYDSTKGGVSIVDENGNTVMNSKGAVKNTGFRINSIIILGIIIISVLIASVYAACRYRLFAQDYEYES